jgi:hypothetical protein
METEAQKAVWDELRAAEAARDDAERRFNEAELDLQSARKAVWSIQCTLSERLRAAK